LAREKVAGEVATTKMDADSRNLKTAAAGSVGGAREPADLNRCMCKPPMRRRSEEGGLGGVTDGEEARAVAMARRSTPQAVARACQGKGRHGSLGVCEGGAEVPWGCLYRLGRGGEGAPGGHGHQWPCGLDGKSRGGIKDGKRASDGGRVKGSFTTA
jgi:hypothetical protein